MYAQKFDDNNTSALKLLACIYKPLVECFRPSNFEPTKI